MREDGDELTLLLKTTALAGRIATTAGSCSLTLLTVSQGEMPRPLGLSADKRVSSGYARSDVFGGGSQFSRVQPSAVEADRARQPACGSVHLRCYRVCASTAPWFADT